CAPATIVAAPHHVDTLRREHLRVPPGAVPPESPYVRQADESVESPAGYRGPLRPGLHTAARQRRNYAPRTAPIGVPWKRARRVWDHQSRPGLCTEKKVQPADPASHDIADVGAGLERRSWVDPAGPANQPLWTDTKIPRHLQALPHPTDDADPKAPAYYGLL